MQVSDMLRVKGSALYTAKPDGTELRGEGPLPGSFLDAEDATEKAGATA